MNNSSVEFLRRFLTRVLERLDRLEQKTPRAQSQPWYRVEFQVPPAMIGGVSAAMLFVVLLMGAEPSLFQATALFLFIAVVMGLFSFYLLRVHPDLAKNDDAMALLAVLFFIDLIWIKLLSVYSHRYFWMSPYATPIGIAPLLVALLLNPRLALVFSFALALLAGIMNGFSLPVTLVAAVGGAGIVAAGSRARSAHQVAQAGMISSGFNMLVVLFLIVAGGLSRVQSVIALSAAFVSGILSAAFSLGILPYLEGFFSRISNLRLVELAAVNHPLLQRMSIEAPGTYHHSLIVASLAEDAANAVGANGLLCRVGAYFHDIGKMVKAEYFIENQGAFGNPHDAVSPSLSKLVITSHVKEGQALAKQYKLDQQVAAFIPQHHGTSQIEYFYLKALKLEATEDEDSKEPVNEESYRYPGPKPQSKETGIVMMADSVEAASRTLEDPNHQRYKDVVHKIINKKLMDGQLNETPLTLRDLRVIAERFTATLTSIHHARIPYPEAESKKEKKDELSLQ